MLSEISLAYVGLVLSVAGPLFTGWAIYLMGRRAGYWNQLWASLRAKLARRESPVPSVTASLGVKFGFHGRLSSPPLTRRIGETFEEFVSRQLEDIRIRLETIEDHTAKRMKELRQELRTHDKTCRGRYEELMGLMESDRETETSAVRRELPWLLVGSSCSALGPLLMWIAG